VTTAEIITIGTEILLGEIQDTNTAWLARQFRQLGIDLYRVTTVGDNTLRIADTIRESFSRADIVFTTGGLGPTIDDPTRNAVAISLNSEIVFHPELWNQINDRFLRRGIVPSENNRKQACLPVSAVAINNPVGTAPAFYVYNNSKMIVCLPGVPAEMETIFTQSVIPLLQQKFTLEKIIKAKILHTSGIRESVIDNLISDLELLENPTVGLSAHPASVDIRITAKNTNSQTVDQMIELIEREVRQRLPDAIFGSDEVSLQQVIASLAEAQNQVIKVYLHGCNASVFPKPEHRFRKWLKCYALPDPFSPVTGQFKFEEDLFFALNLHQGQDLVTLEMFFVKGDQHEISVRSYNGPPSQIKLWLANTCMDFIWRKFRTLENGANNENG